MIKTVSGIASKNSFLMIDFVIDDEGDYESSMTGSDRRQEILKNIKESDRPVSGSKLAKDYDVSRQVIVQDIALLRASGYDIISTNRGYVLEGQTCVERVFFTLASQCPHIIPSTFNVFVIFFSSLSFICFIFLSRLESYTLHKFNLKAFVTTLE